MNINWIAMVTAFVVTLIITVFGGTYLPGNYAVIGPVIGGLIAGYMVGGNYIDGIINGGVPVGIFGLINSTVVIGGNKLSVIAAAYSYTGPENQFFTIALTSAAFAGFIHYFVLGLVGGLIGFFIRERKTIRKILN